MDGDDPDRGVFNRLKNERDDSGVTAAVGATPKDETGRDRRIIELLNRLGDRMIAAERDRLVMREKVRSLDTGLTDMRRGFSARQEQIEKEQKQQAEKLRRAEQLAAKIEEALAQQARLTSRLEQVTQDRARLLSKLESIEATVIDTRDALSERIAGGRHRALVARPDEAPPETFWQAQAPVVQAAGASALIIAAILGGWAIARLPSPLPTLTPSPVSVAVVPNDAASPEKRVAAGMPPPPVAQAEDITADVGAPPPSDILRTTDEQLEKMMDENPDALAASLNALEPSAIDATDGAREDQIVEPAGKTKLPEKDATGSSGIKKSTGQSDVKTKDEVPRKETATVSPAVVQKASPPIVPSAKDFIAAETDPRPLADRIKPDESLPPLIREIEKKAFDGIPEAQHDLAAIYTAGHGGVSTDYKKAAAWFKEAALAGVANARYNLGVLYHQGLGVEKNITKAVGWYRAAAEKEHPEAQYNLGIAYIEGTGVTYEPQLAARYFKEAAQGGIVEAGYNLGLVYENGLLGEPEPKQAIYWYKRAADQGSAESRSALAQLSKTMSLTPEAVERIYKEVGSVAEPPVKTSFVPPAPTPKNQTTQKKPEKTEPPPVAVTGSVPVSPVAPTAPEPTADQTIIAQVQEQLIRLGLYPGPADGVINPLTEDAIRSYQSMAGVERDGRANEALLVHMLTREMEPAAQATQPPAAIAPGDLTADDLESPDEIGSRAQ